jgi:hypothetical protein
MLVPSSMMREGAILTTERLRKPRAYLMSYRLVQLNMIKKITTLDN